MKNFIHKNIDEFVNVVSKEIVDKFNSFDKFMYTRTYEILCHGVPSLISSCKFNVSINNCNGSVRVYIFTDKLSMDEFCKRNNMICAFNKKANSFELTLTCVKDIGLDKEHIKKILYNEIMEL